MRNKADNRAMPSVVPRQSQAKCIALEDTNRPHGDGPFP